MVGGASIYPFAWSVLLAARAEGLAGVMTTMVVRDEEAIKELRESLESEDPAAINTKTETLQTAFHAVSEAMYQRAQEQAAASGEGAAANGAADGAGTSSDEEDVVDAEVVDEPQS